MKRGNIRKFGRTSKIREGLSKSLLTALFDNGRIKTTKSRAKMLSTLADKTITVAKKTTVIASRELVRTLNPALVKKIVSDIAPRFKDRKGGYTRVINLGRRKSDGSFMALVEFTE